MTRRAVRAEIIAAAQALFVEHGFDETTVDQIVERVGMSQRTFFRYVASKDELVLAHFDGVGQAMVDALSTIPREEDPWCALRTVFDVVIEQHRDPNARAVAATAQGIVESSPALLAGYLERMETTEVALTQLLTQRGDFGADWAVLRAVVGSALAALRAVMQHVDTSDSADEIAAELDRVMAVLQPQLP